MRVAIEAVLTGQVLAAWLLLEDLHHEEHPDFRDAVTTTCARMSKRWEGLAPASIPVLAPARELYNALGMEPTRHRPSSEALLRRVLQGKGLYRLDPIVDCGNLFSLAHSLPLGLYDREHIEESITLRLGFEGESYPGIRKDLVNVAGDCAWPTRWAPSDRRPRIPIAVASGHERPGSSPCSMLRPPTPPPSWRLPPSCWAKPSHAGTARGSALMACWESESESYLTMPRSLLRMKSSRRRTSTQSASSASMRSMAWLVFNPAR